MVRLINQDNLKQVTDIVYAMMKVQEFFTYAEEFNNPGISPCIYAMWHENQFGIHGLSNREKLHVLISNSLDGQIISGVCERLGFNVCRGSSNRKGAVSGTLKLLSKLNASLSQVQIPVDMPQFFLPFPVCSPGDHFPDAHMLPQTLL